MFSVDSLVRIPRGFEFLSGFADPVRGRRIIMPIQAFVDESGGKGHTTHFVLAGLVSPSERWFSFADEWRDCMAKVPRIRYFKMSEANSITGEFYGMDKTQRDDKLIALAEVINRNVESFIHFGVVIKDHDEIIGNLSKPLNDVYFWPFLSTILGVAFDLADSGNKEKFEIVFDEQYISGLRARDWYPIARKVAERGYPDVYAVMPADIMFRRDDEFLPLQAADLMAGCYRINLSEASQNFEWLLSKMTAVTKSRNSVVDDRHSLAKWVRETAQNAKDEPPSEDLWNECQALLNKFRKKKTGR